MTVTLILGGARSGKSRRAQELAEAASAQRVFIATAEALDDEMANRIARHQRDRGTGWRTIEAPLDLTHALQEAAVTGGVILIDCLTLWLSNMMHRERDVDAAIAELVNTLREPAELILVSNEVGLGLVPETPLGRTFRDHQGRLNQAIAAASDRVEFVAAGLPLALKG
ncbi:MAG: bifunctional adenosylcobinamide kinase/adenosylcobinamide-phosphate guanylyltransferase [Pseudomonadota bacterium]